MVGLDAKGSIWIIEIKSSLIDFQTDGKWPDYQTHCDRLFFAVNPQFPIEVLPTSTGLMVCDPYGGALIREAPELRLLQRRRVACHRAEEIAAAPSGALTG